MGMYGKISYQIRCESISDIESIFFNSFSAEQYSRLSNKFSGFLNCFKKALKNGQVGKV